jgi:pyruvate/2-oxoglutarate dehydrogenase complex dihydrolipoamide acyltransferase (E2) component
LETDKATMEFESFNEGTLLHIGIPAGETAPVDSLLAIIGKKERIFQHYFQKTSRGNSSCRHSKTYFRGSSCSRNYKESSSVATSLQKE